MTANRRGRGTSKDDPFADDTWKEGVAKSHKSTQRAIERGREHRSKMDRAEFSDSVSGALSSVLNAIGGVLNRLFNLVKGQAAESKQEFGRAYRAKTGQKTTSDRFHEFKGEAAGLGRGAAKAGGNLLDNAASLLPRSPKPGGR